MPHSELVKTHEGRCSLAEALALGQVMPKDLGLPKEKLEGVLTLSRNPLRRV